MRRLLALSKEAYLAELSNQINPASTRDIAMENEMKGTAQEQGKTATQSVHLCGGRPRGRTPAGFQAYDKQHKVDRAPFSTLCFNASLCSLRFWLQSFMGCNANAASKRRFMRDPVVSQLSPSTLTHPTVRLNIFLCRASSLSNCCFVKGVVERL